jgi:alkylation response protein AidB-like acyl-CoA dehydrogenase
MEQYEVSERQDRRRGIQADLYMLVLELFGTQAQKDFAIPHLVSTDPSKSWTAGQWMTERPGGSDVSRTETTARPCKEGHTKSGDKVSASFRTSYSSGHTLTAVLVFSAYSSTSSMASNGSPLPLMETSH